MSSVTLMINDLTSEEKEKVFDLFILVDVFPTTHHDPVHNIHNIEVAINGNDARTLDGVMAYLLKHIVKN